MRFFISEELRQALESVRRRRGYSDDVTESTGAFVLDLGLGPANYLTPDGRVLTDGRAWDGEEVREATDDEAIAALVAGAKNCGVSQLLELIPPRPEGARQCHLCDGTRWAVWGGVTIVCPHCHGRGWERVSAPA